MLPREGVVNANRRAVGVDGQLVRVGGEAQRRSVERRVGLDHFGRIKGPVIGHDVARIRRLVPKAAGCVDGAQHAHQHRQRTHGLKAVGMRRQPAHGVKSQRPRLRGWVYFAPGISPRNGQVKCLRQSGVAHLVGEFDDARGVNAGNGCGPFGRAARHAVAQQLKSRRHARAVGQGKESFGRRL